ncbi:hypothetical protein M8318_15490 [Leclercia sp. H6S3]|uniref:Uncharacterized protein n=1 Tax=Leclercia tamurae TaxID=2926467 RepID=A0ABT2RDV3_9ENTR|nr:hypothetical protein [Leclercia tamurae]MCU6679061.1 hypothetical protein [Leclercia tamurae]
MRPSAAAAWFTARINGLRTCGWRLQGLRRVLPVGNGLLNSSHVLLLGRRGISSQMSGAVPVAVTAQLYLFAVCQ